jgi:hypothetical protein
MDETKATPILDQLRVLTEQLRGLLLNPEPGLLTWNTFAVRKWAEIVDLWHRESAVTEVETQAKLLHEREHCIVCRTDMIPVKPGWGELFEESRERHRAVVRYRWEPVL